MSTKCDVLDSHLSDHSFIDSLTKDEPEGVDDLAAFGWLRGIHARATMLELRKKDGKIVALGYAWLDRAEFDPSGTITLHFVSRSVKITGRHLNAEIRQGVRLFAGIVQHRVPWIQEFDEPAIMQAEKGATVVETIKVSP